MLRIISYLNSSRSWSRRWLAFYYIWNWLSKQIPCYFLPYYLSSAKKTFTLIIPSLSRVEMYVFHYSEHVTSKKHLLSTLNLKLDFKNDNTIKNLLIWNSPKQNWVSTKHLAVNVTNFISVKLTRIYTVEWRNIGVLFKKVTFLYLHLHIWVSISILVNSLLLRKWFFLQYNMREAFRNLFPLNFRRH